MIHAFYSYDFNVRIVAFEPTGHARRHSAAANLQIGNVEFAFARHNHLVGQRTLTRHNQQIVVGMDECPAFRFGKGMGRLRGIVVGIPFQPYIYRILPERSHRLLLHQGSRTRHEYLRGRP